MDVMQPTQPGPLVEAPPTGDADEALVAGIAVGHQGALRRLRERYQPDLRRFVAARTGDGGLVDEILNDTWLAVWRGAATYQRRASVRAWVYGIAWRRWRDALRRAGRLSAPSADLLDRADPAPGPAESLLGLPSAHGLPGRIAALPEGLRAVVLLSFDQRMTHPEIAEVLDIPVGTVARRLSDARRRLRAGAPSHESPTDPGGRP